jgi:hypothetical protein
VSTSELLALLTGVRERGEDHGRRYVQRIRTIHLACQSGVFTIAIYCIAGQAALLKIFAPPLGSRSQIYSTIGAAKLIQLSYVGGVRLKVSNPGDNRKSEELARNCERET